MVPTWKTRNWRSAYLLMLFTSLILTFWSISIAFSSSAVVVQFASSPGTSANLKLPNLPPKNTTPGQKSGVEEFDRRPSYPWRGDAQCQHFVVQVYLAKNYNLNFSDN